MIRIALALLVLLPFLSTGQMIDLGPVKTHCATSEEVELYNLINDYRRIHQLAPIPFSRSLSYVARVHAMDLSINRPDFGGCNPHSWSAKGKWKPCCYSRDPNRQQSMNEKPKEIVGYKFKGWEMVYSGGEEARAVDAFDLWKGLSLTNDYLLNTGKWTKPWKALGIGFYGDYACVWFGEGDDLEKEYGLCLPDTIKPEQMDEKQTDVSIAEQVTNPGNSVEKYYIITGSLNALEKANREVARLRSLGYTKAKLIPSGNNFRISIDEFPTESEAQNSLPDIQKLFGGAWVLKPGE
ncbi:MAG: SPOR domain-containing protein [Bacteroidales bacterium]|nr:SPOR domain-containing protein [Bacteroidales bacterium]